MSLDIWTPCAAGSEPPFRRMNFGAFRVVESQHVIATRKLVDSDEEQALLEQLIDGVKPPVPQGMKRLHYLLSTPFRHPPLRWGSRFGSVDERGIWYGARELATAFTEVAYYRFVFLEGTRAKLTPLSVDLSSFRVKIATARGIDLTAPPFSRFSKVLASKTETEATQRLGRAMRTAGVVAFTYRSARVNEERGTNVGLFVPCFSPAKPFGLRTWTCTTSPSRVEIVERNLLAKSPARFAFDRGRFETNGALDRARW